MEKHKTALITGGARRIGAAIVRDLTKHGFDVAIHYTSSEAKAVELAESLETRNVNTVALEADLTDSSASESLFQNAVEAIGPIDLLINNASIFEADSATGFDEATWDAHFAIHAKAPSILAAAMHAQSDVEAGAIVNIVDQRVLRPTPEFYSYAISKAALFHATKLMALAYAPRLRVNAIGPGPTLQGARQSPEDFAKQVSGLVLKKGPELEEFGKTVRYLYETPSVTGQMIALDGGQHLAWETPDIAGIRE